MCKVFGVMLAMVALLGLVAPAGADIVYTPGSNAYLVPVNGTVSVPIYLEFTGADAGLLDAANENGLAGAGVDLIRTGAVPSDPATPINVTENAGFDFVSVLNLLPDQVEFVENVIANPTYVGVNSDKVLLGTFKFKAGAVVGETTWFRFQNFDADPLTLYTVTGNFTGLDDQIMYEDLLGDPVGLFSITTIAGPSGVPLPSVSLMGMGCMALVGLIRRPRLS